MIDDEELNEESFLTEDKDNDQIREELKHMSFEDLQKLKEKLGTKIYNETIFGKKTEKPRRMKPKFHRENCNRPYEMSSKRPKPTVRNNIPIKKKVIARDPRFDSLCGTFDAKAFKRSYAFINQLKEKDLKTLRKELEQTTDQKTINKIKYLIQRLENQLREEERNKRKEERKREEDSEMLESIKQGGKPTYKKKSEKRILNLISQYEELKETGKLRKHMKRLRKKNKHKDRINFKMNNREMEEL